MPSAGASSAAAGDSTAVNGTADGSGAGCGTAVIPIIACIMLIIWSIASLVPGTGVEGNRGGAGGVGAAIGTRRYQHRRTTGSQSAAAATRERRPAIAARARSSGVNS